MAAQLTAASFLAARAASELVAAAATVHERVRREAARDASAAVFVAEAAAAAADEAAAAAEAVAADGDAWRRAFVDARFAARLGLGRARCPAALPGHTAAVAAVSVAADVAAAVTASADGSARIWQLGGGGGGGARQLAVLQHTAPVVAAVAISAELAVTATAAGAQLWRRGQRVRAFPVHTPVRPLAAAAALRCTMFAPVAVVPFGSSPLMLSPRAPLF